MNYKHGTFSISDLPGLKKKSFSMYFGGGEIWFEHLDGIYTYTDLAIKKLEEDYITFKRPSSPSLIAINVDETRVDDSLIQVIAEKLLESEKRFTLNFINDFEKAKQWLVSEAVQCR